MKPIGDRFGKFASSFLLLVCVSLLLFCTSTLPLCAQQSITVTSANPNNAPQGTINLNVLVNGQGFKKGALAKFFVSGTTDTGGISVNSTIFINSGQLNANISVAGNAAVTNFDIVVKLTDGRSGKGTQLFRVTAPDPAIAFTTSDSTSNYLMVMNADGTNQKILLQQPKQANIYFGAPNWSPDGTQLVFGSNIQGSGIYIINKDGTALHKVVATNDWFFNDAVWSPAPAADSLSKIAFADNFPGLGCHDLFIVNLDGTGLLNLTNSPGLDEFYPTWDHYATRLAGQSSDCNVGTPMHLYKYDLALVNGVVGITSTTDLTAAGPLQNSQIYKPDWAKTQDKIVLEARLLSDINNSALWEVSLADPANPVELTATYGISALGPSWSPDDLKIVFQQNSFSAKYHMYVINADGSGLADLGVTGSRPDWRRNP
ncbi:MAG: hypothetical protein WAQ52_00345 [Terriglobales bacterium]